MISDDEIHDALEYLRTNAPKAAQAKANRIYLEEYRKTIKANGMQKHLDKPVTAQEREAYQTKEYTDHLLIMQEAIRVDELNRWGMVAATAKIEAWRSFNANHRGEGKMR